jgi:HSF-type DNA-binding
LSFKVFLKEDFEQIILPKYFQKQSKYWSFTRKLGRWGFIRITSGPESGSYQHPLFQRGHPELLAQMTCQSGNSISVATVVAPSSRGQLNNSGVTDLASLAPTDILMSDNRSLLRDSNRFTLAGMSQPTRQALPTDLEQTSKRMKLNHQHRQLDPLITANRFYPSLHQSTSSSSLHTLPLDLLAEQQLQQQLLNLAARSTVAASVTSPVPSLFGTSLPQSSPSNRSLTRSFDLLEERERFLTQELLRHQMQQEEDKLLFQLMVENRRNQLTGTQTMDLLRQHHQPQQNLTLLSSGNSLNVLQQQRRMEMTLSQNSAAVAATYAEQHNIEGQPSDTTSPERERKKTQQQQNEDLAAQILQLHHQQQQQQQQQQEQQKFHEMRKSGER